MTEKKGDTIPKDAAKKMAQDDWEGGGRIIPNLNYTGYNYIL